MIDDPVRAAGGTLGEYAYMNRADRPVSDLLKDIIGNVQEMVRSEIRLARAEMREEVDHATSAAKLIGIGAGLALLAGAFLLVTCTLLLALVMPAWVAALIVGAVLGIAGMVMLGKGRAQFRVPRPKKTIENVKENVEWMKNQTR
jgi:uncharacterized membrane protein YqjE